MLINTRIIEAQNRLLDWYHREGRLNLPWRSWNMQQLGTKCDLGYSVLVSEFMLQQTTVAMVTKKFTDWMVAFPSMMDLALATEEQILARWEGLGYYNRARNLHRTAQIIIQNHHGIIPRNIDTLLSLPGVGRYTASALLAFVFDEAIPVLDTNIQRVLVRWNNEKSIVTSTAGKNRIHEFATIFFHQNSSRYIASALMDLGSLICLNKNPSCDQCPIRNGCLAENPSDLPRKYPKISTTYLTEARGWIFQNNHLYLEQSEGPRWKKLWIFPLLDSIPSSEPLISLDYSITRYRIKMQLFPIQSQKKLSAFYLSELAHLPMGTPHRKILNKLLDQKIENLNV